MSNDTTILPFKRLIKEPKATGQGYYSATGYKTARLDGFDSGSMGTSGRREMEYDRNVIVNMSRELYRNNPIYNGLINTAVDYIVGTGHKLQCVANDKEQQEQANLIETLWNEFWVSPEFRGVLNGRQVEVTTCKEILICGDTASLKIKGGLIQLIESEQITGKRSSGYDDGIMTDDYGKIKSFNICPYKNGYVSRSGTTYKKEDVIYIGNLERPSDVRAMPVGQPAFAMLHRISDVCDSESIAMQTIARFAIAITGDGISSSAYANSVTDDSISTDKTPIADRVTDLGWGMIFTGNTGEKIEGISRNIPGKDFPETIRTYLRLLGLPFGLPLELTFLDWTQSNYSQSRAVLEHCKRRFAQWQSLIQDNYLTKILEWKIAEWKKKGLIGDFDFSHAWIGPAFPWLDPEKEANAWSKQMESNMSSLHEVLQSQGKDYDRIINVRFSEISKAIEVVKQIEKETGVSVPYEAFCGLPYPKKSNSDNTTESVSVQTDTKGANNG